MWSISQGTEILTVTFDEKTEHLELGIKQSGSKFLLETTGGGERLQLLVAVLQSRPQPSDAPSSPHRTENPPVSLFGRPASIIPAEKRAAYLSNTPSKSVYHSFVSSASPLARKQLDAAQLTKSPNKPQLIISHGLEEALQRDLDKHDKEEHSQTAAARSAQPQAPYTTTQRSHRLTGAPRPAQSSGNKPNTANDRTQLPITLYCENGDQNARPQDNSTRPPRPTTANSLQTAPEPTLSSRTISALPPLSLSKFHNNRGIVNTGNSCYINATLQALMSLPTFVTDLRAKKLRELAVSLNLRSLYKAILSIVDEAKLAAQRTGPLDPLRVKYSIARHCPDFRNSAQQDAHEFLVAFLTNLEAELLPDLNKAREKQQLEALKPNDIEARVAKSIRMAHRARKPDPTASKTDTSLHADDGDATASSDVKPSPSIQDGVPFSERLTLLCPSKRNFAGALQLKVTCGQCQHSSTAIESFRHLTIDVFKSKQSLIDHVLSNLQGPNGEPFDEDRHRQDMEVVLNVGDSNAMPSISDLLFASFNDERIEKRCEKCSHKTALLERKLIQLPRVLVIHLKRFSYNMATHEHTKLKYKTSLDAQIDLQNFCATDLDCAGPINLEPQKQLDETEERALTEQLKEDEQTLGAMLQSERETRAPSPYVKSYTTTSSATNFQLSSNQKKPTLSSNLPKPSTMGLQSSGPRFGDSSTSISLSAGGSRNGIPDERSDHYQDVLANALNGKSDTSVDMDQDDADDWLNEPTFKQPKLEEVNTEAIHRYFVVDPPTYDSPTPTPMDSLPQEHNLMDLSSAASLSPVPDSPGFLCPPGDDLPSSYAPDFDPKVFPQSIPIKIGTGKQEDSPPHKPGLKGGGPPLRGATTHTRTPNYSGTDADYADAFAFTGTDDMSATYASTSSSTTSKASKDYVSSIKKYMQVDSTDSDGEVFAPTSDDDDATRSDSDGTEDLNDDSRLPRAERSFWQAAARYYHHKTVEMPMSSFPLPALTLASWVQVPKQDQAKPVKPSMSYGYLQALSYRPSTTGTTSSSTTATAAPITLDDDDNKAKDNNDEDNDEDFKRAIAESKAMEDERNQKRSLLAEIRAALEERRTTYSVYGTFDTDANKEKKDETNPWEQDQFAPLPTNKKKHSHASPTSFDPPRPPLSFEYALHAVVNHIGETTSSGHYIADVCDDQDTWITFDDNLAHPTDLRQVLAREVTPYILFYVNKSVLTP